MAIELGTTFWLKTPPNGEHICFIAAITLENKCLILNTTTSITKWTKQDYIIYPNEEGIPSCITTKCVVHYRKAKLYNIDNIIRLMRKKEINIINEKFGLDIIHKIQEYGKSHHFTKDSHVEIFRDCIEERKFKPKVHKIENIFFNHNQRINKL
ncbi:MAG: hypothetical protein RLZZ425_1002 [Bacteroidota bacterium]|jgi:hypothetical protein